MMNDSMDCKRVYSADGVKLKARHITAIPQGTGSSSSSTNYIMSKDSTDYIGDFIYHNNKFSRYNWGNGYIVPTGSSSGYAYRFYFKDHQGNNRLVTSYTGVVQQTTHYYPDGVTHDKSTEQGLQRYKYNGKELDRMHGLDWYDYGARQYDPTIGQFTSMDPLCEKYYHISPYAYCAGNPVKYVDPDGRKVYLFSTQLPGANYVPFATHTFLVVQDSNGKITYAAYGARNNDCISGNDALTRCNYSDDLKAIKNFFEGNQKSNHVKGIDLIPIPDGMSSDEFDTKVINTINSFGNNSKIKYNLNPTEETEGNCNSSSSTILILSGVPKETVEQIGDKMQGINWGFSSKPKPWTYMEQEKAADNKTKRSMEEKERIDALQKALQ